MKKGIIIVFLSLVAFGIQAQKLNIQNAIDAIKSDDIAKAKSYIDKATKNESTSKNSTAWLVKAFVYQAIGTDQSDLINPKTKEKLPFVANINGKKRTIDLGKANSLRPTTPEPFQNAIKAFNRYIFYNKKHDKDIVATALSSMLLINFNKAINSYNKTNYKKALEYLEVVDKVVGIRKGSFYPSLGDKMPQSYFKKQAADIAAKSKKMSANAAFYAGDKDKAISLLKANIDSKTGVDDGTYIKLASLYKDKGDEKTYLEMIKMGLTKFPKSEGLKNEELNFLITSGKAAQAVVKLEDAIKTDPSNPEYFFNAGALYSDLIKAEKDPKKRQDYFDKAEARYKKAIELSPATSDYQLNLGALYFNKSAEVTKRMNAEQDLDKYEVIKKERNGWLSKALPILVKTRTSLEKQDLSKAGTKNSYKQVLGALSDIYARLDKLDKVIAIKAKLKTLD